MMEPGISSHRRLTDGIGPIIAVGLFTIAAAVIGAFAQYELSRPTPRALISRQEAVPDSGDQITLDVPADSLLYFSGSDFAYQGRTCSASTNLCVFLDSFSSARTVTIDRVITGQNFVAEYQGWSEADLLAEFNPAYWDARNCGSTGCGYVDVYFFRDGELDEQWRLSKPDQ